MSPFLAFTTELLEEEQHLQLKKKAKDPLKPKQPMSAFLMFKNERRAALLAESKGGWEIAKQNKKKYLEEMEAYKQRKEEESANLKKEDEARSRAIAQEERENR
ncbi:High mobility group B protein 13 [Camellia lanceoleosa]|uniref:High mobility group B protein 13 n=1 Tax=Camellia lanceoleosa TaxID=1840588 RepID=A0ACC0HSI2_9ERIC|nr:High mobility group B protein 13 [Camellia lanceoleosa]